MPINSNNLLLAIPDSLRSELIESYTGIEKNFRERRWEPSELNGGKLCEVVYTILKGYMDGRYPNNASKPRNMVDACRALEQYPSSYPRSLRIQIPRMLTALYEIRNNRGVGHVGGDVNPNKMDATCVLQMSKWVLSELIRVFHNVETTEASNFIDTLSEREVSLIWQVNGVSRVLDVSLSMLQKTLLLLYQSPSGISESNLFNSVEHSNSSTYRREVLKKAHKAKLLEYDPLSRIVTISPIGSQKVENEILK